MKSLNDHIKELKDEVEKQFRGVIDMKDDKTIGKVISFADGVAFVDGLKDAKIGQRLAFPDSTALAKKIEGDDEPEIFGVVEDIDEFAVKCLVFGEEKYIKEGDKVINSSDELKIPVTSELLGRVVDPFCNPLFKKENTWMEEIEVDVDNRKYKTLKIKDDVLELPIERKSPGIIDRAKIKEPLETGIKFIDSMLPIGRGQRMLLIGDRSIGKTAIILDTIYHQTQINNKLNGDKKFAEHHKDTVYCIYVAIGKKISEIRQIMEKIKDRKYTIIIAALANDPAPLLYIAPFVGCTIGEYFRDIGRHAVIFYDDLTKHANAYRQISLILKRPPGREAYPGDIFYLHSRLLERASKIKEYPIKSMANAAEFSENISTDYINLIEPFFKTYKVRKKDKDYEYKFLDNENYKFRTFKKALGDNGPEVDHTGGGSLTAIPVIETKQGDYSSYVATNIISITDGQIFLNEKLKNDLIRPSIDVGLSVSRIGKSAQYNTVNEVSLAAGLKERLAIYRDKKKFAQYGMELQPADQEIVNDGERLYGYLVQNQFETVGCNRLTLGLLAFRIGLFDAFELKDGLSNDTKTEIMKKLVVDFENKLWNYYKNDKTYNEMINRINKSKDSKLGNEKYENIYKLIKALEELQIQFLNENAFIVNEYFKYKDVHIPLSEFNSKVKTGISDYDDPSREIEPLIGFYFEKLLLTKREYRKKYIETWFTSKEEVRAKKISDIVESYQKELASKRSEYEKDLEKKKLLEEQKKKNK